MPVHEQLQNHVTDRRSIEIIASLAGPFETAISGAASPERALAGFERLLLNTRYPASLLETLAYAPHSIGVLATIFAGSQFLTDILFRNPDYVARITERHGIGQDKPGTQLDAEARRRLIRRCSPVRPLSAGRLAPLSARRAATHRCGRSLWHQRPDRRHPPVISVGRQSDPRLGPRRGDALEFAA